MNHKRKAVPPGPPPPTLKTNISPRRMAMVSKWPSQMLGPKRGVSWGSVGWGSSLYGVRDVTGGGTGPELEPKGVGGCGGEKKKEK